MNRRKFLTGVLAIAAAGPSVAQAGFDSAVFKAGLDRAEGLFLFEYNDALTRSYFHKITKDYLEPLLDAGKIYDYQIICDSTNNTPEVINSGSFVGEVLIRPSKSLEFKQITYKIQGTKVQFEDAAH